MAIVVYPGYPILGGSDKLVVMWSDSATITDNGTKDGAHWASYLTLVNAGDIAVTVYITGTGGQPLPVSVQVGDGAGNAAGANGFSGTMQPKTSVGLRVPDGYRGAIFINSPRPDAKLFASVNLIAYI